VQFEGATQGVPSTDGPSFGFFLLSLQRDVDATLAGLVTLGFDDGVRRIEMPAPGGKTVADGGLALHSPIDSYGQMQRVLAHRRPGSAER
jgi:hypothetical protein